jgi:hypothetical protein
LKHRSTDRSRHPVTADEPIHPGYDRFVKSKADPELRLARELHFNQANWYRHLRASLSLLPGANSLRLAVLVQMPGAALLAHLMLLMQCQIHLAN